MNYPSTTGSTTSYPHWSYGTTSAPSQPIILPNIPWIPSPAKMRNSWLTYPLQMTPDMFFDIGKGIKSNPLKFYAYGSPWGILYAPK